MIGACRQQWKTRGMVGRWCRADKVGRDGKKMRQNHWRRQWGGEIRRDKEGRGGGRRQRRLVAEGSDGTRGQRWNLLWWMAADATKSISNVGGGGYMPPTMEERTMPGSMGGAGDYAFDEGQNPVQHWVSIETGSYGPGSLRFIASYWSGLLSDTWYTRLNWPAGPILKPMFYRILEHTRSIGTPAYHQRREEPCPAWP